MSVISHYQCRFSLQITKSITSQEAGSTLDRPHPTVGNTVGASGIPGLPPVATKSTTTGSTGTITAKSIVRRRVEAGRTTRPCGTTTTESLTLTMIVIRTPPAPALGADMELSLSESVQLRFLNFYLILNLI